MLLRTVLLAAALAVMLRALQFAEATTPGGIATLSPTVAGAPVPKPGSWISGEIGIIAFGALLGFFALIACLHVFCANHGAAKAFGP